MNYPVIKRLKRPQIKCEPQQCKSWFTLVAFALCVLAIMTMDSCTALGTCWPIHYACIDILFNITMSVDEFGRMFNARLNLQAKTGAPRRKHERLLAVAFLLSAQMETCNQFHSPLRNRSATDCRGRQERVSCTSRDDDVMGLTQVGRWLDRLQMKMWRTFSLLPAW